MDARITGQGYYIELWPEMAQKEAQRRALEAYGMIGRQSEPTWGSIAASGWGQVLYNYLVSQGAVGNDTFNQPIYQLYRDNNNARVYLIPVSQFWDLGQGKNVPRYREVHVGYLGQQQPQQQPPPQQQPQQQTNWNPPVGPVPTGDSARAYQAGRADALYYNQGPLPVDPPAYTLDWWRNEGRKDVVNHITSRTGIETVIVGGLPPPGTPPPNLPPSTWPPPNQGPLVGPVAVTYEIYGDLGGRQTSVWKALSFDGMQYHIRQGGHVHVTRTPGEGYGYGGTPGRWGDFYALVSPANYQLDPDKGVLAYDEDSRRPFAVSAAQLQEIWGPNWRATVYI